jgi:arginine repressor
MSFDLPTNMQLRGLFFLKLKEHGLTQPQIIEYCRKYNGENFSQSTVSRGIKEGQLIASLEEKKAFINENVPGINKELLTAVIKVPDVLRKYRKK